MEDIQLLHIKKALELSKKAYEAAKAAIRPGACELDVYRAVEEALCGAAGHRVEFIGDFISGPRTAGIEGPATDRVLCPGDLYIMDLSVRYESAWSDTCRTFFLGRPNDKMRSAYRSVLGCMERCEREVRQGVPAAQLKTAAREHMLSCGFGGHMPHHAGHGIGAKPFQAPVFEPGDHTPVEAGMTVTLEPGLYFDGEWGIRVENDYLVTESGLENLFDYPTDINYFTIL